MTWVRAIASAPITAASAGLGVRPAPVLRGALAAAGFPAGTVFFAMVFLAATFLPVAALAAGAYFAAGSLAVVLPAAALRGGNFEARGSNSKFTLPASGSQARNALK